MAKKGQHRGIMWAAAITMACAAAVNWWRVLAKGETGVDLVAPIAFTVSAVLLTVSVLISHARARGETSGGETR